jgi:hypothetical protein
MFRRANMTRRSESRLLNGVDDVAVGTVNNASTEWEEKPCDKLVVLT